MRITGRALRKIINEELSRANKLTTIREGVDLDSLRYNAKGQIVDEKGGVILLDPYYVGDIRTGLINCSDMLQALLTAGIITNKAIRTFGEMSSGYRPKTVMAIRDAFSRKLGAKGEVLAFLNALEQDVRLDMSDMPKITGIIGNADKLLLSVFQFINNVAVDVTT